jgi:hypothetical protein
MFGGLAQAWGNYGSTWWQVFSGKLDGHILIGIITFVSGENQGNFDKAYTVSLDEKTITDAVTGTVLYRD